MVTLAEYSWDTNTWTHNTPAVEPDDTLSAHARWEASVETVHAKAVEALPGHTARLDLARLLVLDGAVVPQQDGSFLVQSQTLGDKRQYRVNGRCECPVYAKQAQGYCKHRLATFLYRRAQELMHGTPAHDQAEASEQPAREEKLTLDLDPQLLTAQPELETSKEQPTSEPVYTRQSIPQHYIVLIQNKPFVRYAGLLQMAQERGLTSLEADWTYNDENLSLAHAVAIFADGRRFEESGDASPANTNRKVAVHFRRVALTRAKARVLRDALGIDLVAVEELADSD
jgi:hypothetical protein